MTIACTKVGEPCCLALEKTVRLKVTQLPQNGLLGATFAEPNSPFILVVFLVVSQLSCVSLIPATAPRMSDSAWFSSCETGGEGAMPYILLFGSEFAGIQ